MAPEGWNPIIQEEFFDAVPVQDNKPTIGGPEDFLEDPIQPYLPDESQSEAKAKIGLLS